MMASTVHLDPAVDPAAQPMLRLAGVVLAVGLADSLNPSTVGPALYLATGQRPVVRVSLFALGVFAVNLAAGIVLAAGPGRLLVALIPRPDRAVRHALELAAGIVLIAIAVALWLGPAPARRPRAADARAAAAGSALVAGGVDRGGRAAHRRALLRRDRGDRRRGARASRRRSPCSCSSAPRSSRR